MEQENQAQQHKRRVRYKGKYPKKFEEKYKELQPEKYQDTVQHVIRKGNTPAGMHISIMVKEILDFLQIQPGETGFDATLGYGGHTKAMLECLHGSGHMYATDVDPEESAKTKKRLEELEASKDTAWRVGENDWWQNKHYDKCEEVFDKYLTDTNASVAPWYIIDSGDKKWAELQVLETLCSGIHVAMQNESLAVPILQNVFPLVKMPKLSEVELDKEISEEEYKKELRHLQKKLNALHYRLYRKKIPVVIAYEGWDAAGKGGNIKRIAGALDPRGYEVHPIASPEPHEKARHYLWRFWTRLPKTGHIAIFDRTWYGRVMVERLEGFCSTNDWQRAYNEINEFEKELSQWGAVIIKFWVQIDKDTQLERFTERQNTPEKQWKITDEDWRNRDKWDQYEDAVNEMLQKTSTEYAPWHILESVDKKYARIKALKIVIEELEKALG